MPEWFLDLDLHQRHMVAWALGYALYSVVKVVSDRIGPL